MWLKQTFEIKQKTYIVIHLLCQNPVNEMQNANLNGKNKYIKDDIKLKNNWNNGKMLLFCLFLSNLHQMKENLI